MKNDALIFAMHSASVESQIPFQMVRMAIKTILLVAIEFRFNFLIKELLHHLEMY